MDVVSTRYCIFVIYYVVFRVAIKVLKLNTPGRGDNLLADPTSETDAKQADENTNSNDRKYSQTAIQIIEGLGGKEKYSLTNCANTFTYGTK